MQNEILAFKTLLQEEFDPNSQLVCYTHRILCETFKNKFVRLGQPENQIIDGVEYGPCGLQGFVEIAGRKYKLKMLVKDVLEKINNEVW